MFFLTIANLFISLADILSLALMLLVVSFYTSSTSTVSNYLPGWLADPRSINLILLFLVFFSLKNFAAYLVNQAQFRFMANVASRISENKLLQYLEGSYANYTEKDSAVFIRRISYQPLEFCQYVLDGLQQIIMQVMLILFAVVGILLFNAKLFFLILMILLPPVIAVFYLIKKRLRMVRLNVKSASEKSFQYLQEAITGFVESNIYHKNPFFLDRYILRQKEIHKYLADGLIAQGLPNRIIEVFALLGLFILISLSQWSGLADQRAVITIGAFMAAAYKIIPGIVKILNVSGQMNTYENIIEDLLPSVINEFQNRRDQTALIRSIDAQNISFHYNHQPIFKGVELHFRQGDFVGITGASGKGKTTLLNVLLGFLENDEGVIKINDGVTSAVERTAFWPRIAYVKQQAFLIHDTILHNIVLDHDRINEKQFDWSVRLSGVDQLMDTSEQGRNKMITENGKNISGGQRQRIAIARALYKDADVIILDEPFNELDEGSEKALLEHFRELATSGKIILLVTHNTQSLAYCNKNFHLDEQTSSN